MSYLFCNVFFACANNFLSPRPPSRDNRQNMICLVLIVELPRTARQGTAIGNSYCDQRNNLNDRGGTFSERATANFDHLRGRNRKTQTRGIMTILSETFPIRMIVITL